MSNQGKGDSQERLVYFLKTKKGMNKLEIQILKAINPHFEDGDGDAMIADLSKLILEIADKSIDALFEMNTERMDGEDLIKWKEQYLSELSGNTEQLKEI